MRNSQIGQTSPTTTAKSKTSERWLIQIIKREQLNSEKAKHLNPARELFFAQSNLFPVSFLLWRVPFLLSSWSSFSLGKEYSPFVLNLQRFFVCLFALFCIVWLLFPPFLLFVPTLRHTLLAIYRVCVCTCVFVCGQQPCHKAYPVIPFVSL